MGIIFGLCCLLLSPIVLFTYGVVRHLHLLHDELTSPRAETDSLYHPDTDAIIRSADSGK